MSKKLTTISNLNISADRLTRMKNSTSNSLAMEAKNVFREIEELFGQNLESFNYFKNLYKKLYIDKNLEFDKKIVSYTCLFFPEEFAYALDLIPIRVCSGAYPLEQIGAEFLSARSCPMVKALYGSLTLNEMNDLYKSSLMVVPTACDQKKKIVDLVPDESDLFLLEVPQNKESEDAINSWYLSINKLIKKLESVSGKKLKKNKLKEAILKVQKAREEYRKFHDLITTYPVIYGSLSNIVLNSYFIDNVESWTNALIKLNNEIETLAKNKKFIANNNIRIMLSGAPSIFPNIKIPILIEKYGALLVSDDFCSTNRMLNDAVAVDEWNLYDMIPAVADRYLVPCSCPNFIRNNDRARILIDKVKEHKIDGVIYQSLSGCYLHDIEYIKIKNQFEENNIPLLYFETDYSKDDLGQLTTRIEAFFESIKTRK